MSTGVSPIYSNNRIVDSSTGEILGTTGKSVANDESPADRRRLRYELQAIAAKILPTEQVAQCMHRCGQGGVAVNVSQSSGVASFGGLATCHSVWHCPVCSAKISNARRKELNQVLEWSRAMAYQPILVTLTARHGVDDSLGDLLDKMKLAKKKLHQSREWKRLDGALAGHITATEVTHGANGWHVHYHMICIVTHPEQEAAMQLCNLEDVWLRVLFHKDIELGGNGYAFDCQNASAAGDYVSKWGAAEEVTLSGSKKGNGKGSTPFQLLALAGSDLDSRALFLEYAKEFKGKRQLVWSRGLKRLLDIIDKSDQEVSEEPEVEDYVEIAIIPKASWRLVVRRRLQAELLEVAEQGGAAYIEYWLLALHNQERLKDGVQNTEVGS